MSAKIRAIPFFPFDGDPVVAIVKSKIHQLSDCINYMKQFGRASGSHLIIKHSHELFIQVVCQKHSEFPTTKWKRELFA
jgi:hypothetical protein